MTAYKEKVIQIYTGFFMNERKLAFSQRMKKAKKDCMQYIEDRIKNTESKDDFIYWQTIKKYAQRL